jgi:hypothetical protein
MLSYGYHEEQTIMTCLKFSVELFRKKLTTPTLLYNPRIFVTLSSVSSKIRLFKLDSNIFELEFQIWMENHGRKFCLWRWLVVRTPTRIVFGLRQVSDNARWE